MTTSIQVPGRLSFWPLLLWGIAATAGLIIFPVLGVAVLAAGILYVLVQKQSAARPVVVGLILAATAVMLLIAAFVASILSASAPDGERGSWLALLAGAAVSLLGAGGFVAAFVGKKSGQPLAAWVASIGAAVLLIALVALFVSVAAGVSLADAGRSTSGLDSIAVVSLIAGTLACVAVSSSVIIGIRNYRRSLGARTARS